MDFTLTADQAALATSLDKLAARYETKPTAFHGFALTSPALEQELEDGGFFEIARIPELGPLAAAMAVERLARLPYAAEVALSMLVRPQLEGDWPRPFALVENGRPGRFVAQARTVLAIEGETVTMLQPLSDTVEPVDSLFAYPMGRLASTQGGTVLPDGPAVRKWLRVALAAEAAGLMQAAIATTVEHVSLRQQFGRPLGSLQALRHRLAECTMLAGGLRLLALKAAWTEADGDAALAALHAQESATRIVYDLHQMLGAMGMTLEHPLHLWTYRLKALIAELGGRGGQAGAVAQYGF